MDNTISSTAEYYHERTKYRPDNISGHSLDWSKKPPQFKEYPGAESIRLDDKLPFSSEGPVNLRDFPSANGELSAEALARLLFFTNGVTGIMQQPGEYHYYRAAPSAGALYPTDIYLAIRNTPDIPSGIYNFHVRDHRLQRIAPVGFLPADDELFEVLSKATLGHPAIAKSDAILILSTIFLRSSWRYGQRAYRRCMLDTGHVFGNLAAYAPLEGFAATPIAGFVDKEVNDLLGLDPAKEGACVIAPLLAKDDCDVGDDFGLLRSSPYGGYEEVKEENLLNSLVTRSAIQRSSAALARALPDSSGTGRYGASKLKSYSGVTLDSPPPPLHEELRETILRRRSTRAFSGNPITLEQLGHLLEYAYRYDLAGESYETPRYFDPLLLETWVIVHAVSGLQQGTYYYSPATRELKLVGKGDYRQQTHYLALGQELASDAAFVVIHTCDLPAAVERFGDRAYRMIHLDAGHIGQRLNLAAIALELGASGIGGFFDEEVNSLLFIPEREACVYITCIGDPA